MPVPRETEVPFRENSKQVGVNKILGSGSVFRGFQKSKGNSYEVEVVLQVRLVFHVSNVGFVALLAMSRVQSTKKDFFCEVNGTFQLAKSLAF